MNKLHLSLALLLVLILGTFAEASFKLDSLRLRRRGDGEDGGDGEDENENEEDRQNDYEVEDDGVKIESESESENEDSRDKAEIEIKTSDNGSLRIRVKWYTRSDDTKEAFDFKVRFDEIFEYVETSPVGDGYNDTIDTIVQHYVFGFDSTWVAPTTTEGANGETIFTFVTSDGVFRVDFIITGSLTETESGSTLSPNEMKIDVYINNFPYSTTGTYLGLVGKVQTKLESEHDDESEDEQGTSLEGGAAYFTWATTVDADGVTVDVITSSYEGAEVDDDYDDESDGGDGEDTQDGARRRGDDDGDDGGDGEDEDIEDREETATEFVWAFNTNAQPTSIYWDPRIGTKGIDASSAHTLSAAFLAVAAALALAF